MTTSTTPPRQPVHPTESRISPADEAACESVLAQWMAALNRHDAGAMDALMQFPHVRVAANKVVVYDAPGHDPMGLFRALQAQDGWHHSAWNETRLVQSSPVKAHYAVRYTRFREDGSVIGVYDSLYVMRSVDSRWRIECRSSFGP